MRRSLILYETHYGTSKKVAEICSLILGAAKVENIENPLMDITNYDNVVLVFGFYGYNTALKLKEYVKINKEKLLNMRIAVIGVGISKKDLKRYSDSIAIEMGRPADISEFIEGNLEVNKLTEEDRKLLEVFLSKVGLALEDMGVFKEEEACNIVEKCAELLNKPSIVMEREELKNEIYKFIKQHNTCALATATAEFVRCTPIEYVYYDDAFYFISEGGVKFKGIISNKKVSIAIFQEYKDMQSLEGLQVSGKAEIIPCYSDEYTRVMKEKGIDINKLKHIPFDLNLIKVRANKFEFLNSEFKKKGIDVKQTLIL